MELGKAVYYKINRKPGNVVCVNLEFDSLPDSCNALFCAITVPDKTVYHPSKISTALKNSRGQMSHSGYGEDTWIKSQFPEGFQGYAVEVGANDGLSTSPTYDLELAGWTVLCVEPNPRYAQDLKRRKLVELVACSDKNADNVEFSIHEDAPGSFSSLKPSSFGQWAPSASASWSKINVPVRTLDHLLNQHAFPRLDALAIDTEGTEMDVLKGLDLDRWKPRCLVIESWHEPLDFDSFLEPFGYKRMHRFEVNNLYLLS